MFDPGPPIGGEVEEQGLESVDGGGEAALGRLTGLELVPHGPEVGGLVVGQQRVEPVGGRLLAGGLGHLGHLVVDVGVAGVDLDDVVDQHHLEHTEDVDGRFGVFGEYEDGESQVPHVLGIVLLAAAVGHVALAKYLLGLVHLDQEGELPHETFGPAHEVRVATAQMVATKPTTIITADRATGARVSSPSFGDAGGRKRAKPLPTSSAPPRASTR